MFSDFSTTLIELLMRPRIVHVSKSFPNLQSPFGFNPISIFGHQSQSNNNHQKDVVLPNNNAFISRSCNRELLSHFGFISDALGASSFIQLPNFRRSLKKLIRLVDNELEKLGAQELLLPTIVPQRLWDKSERLKRDSKALDNVFQLIDHEKRKLLLGPTFEESITHLMAHIHGSILEHELPILLHQSSPKFRLESNPKFGIIRSNEFFMNDLYSFDSTLESATNTYKSMNQAYENILNKLGLPFIKTLGSSGDIGGVYSHEYQLPVSSGQDLIVECKNCHHTVNEEALRLNNQDHKHVDEMTCQICGSSNLVKLSSIELAHTFLLGDTYSKPMGAKFTCLDGTRRNYQMGCYGIGLTRIIGAAIDLLSITPNSNSNNSAINSSKKMVQLRWPRYIEPFRLGLVPPAKRSIVNNQSKATNFIESFLDMILKQTRYVDILVEDRDKEGIGSRLLRLQCLGLPYIMVVGRKFLEEKPLVEMLKLDHTTGLYGTIFLSEDQIHDFICREIDDVL